MRNGQVAQRSGDDSPKGLLRQPFFTKQTLCEYLVISPSTLDRLVRAGRLGAHRIGGQLRFDPDDVEEFIAATKE